MVAPVTGRGTKRSIDDLEVHLVACPLAESYPAQWIRPGAFHRVVALDERTRWLLARDGFSVPLLAEFAWASDWAIVHERIFRALPSDIEAFDLFANLIVEQASEAVLLGDALERLLRQSRPVGMSFWLASPVLSPETVAFLERIALSIEIPIRQRRNGSIDEEKP
jgi:hypothetical protein